MPVFVPSENSCQMADEAAGHLFDDGEDPGFVIVVSVRPDA